ncbi:MAG: colanic acid biosynthesis glycosyltransferase WcaL [Gammaproteobacteria bacterium]|nr:MAG: colanic acid biosynthesis glycosyltransferase WcaL [Gammaproteobacteria bacterium]
MRTPSRRQSPTAAASEREGPRAVTDRSAARVAYIVSRFPDLTETFVLYEILEIERLGMTVEICPLLRGRERVAHDAVGDLVERARYHGFLSLPILYALWHFLRRRPLAYFKTLVEILTGTFGSANFFFGALAIFPKAVRLAYELEALGVVHVHAQFANHPAVAALIVHRLTDIPFSFTARGSDIHVDRRMLKEKLEAASFGITVSAHNKELMLQECRSHLRDKIHVIYGGIDTELFSPSSEGRRDRTSAGPFSILCVARFEEVKGHACLIEACQLLRARGVDFHCQLIGDGPLRPRIERQIARSGLGDRVQLLGACPHRKVIERLSAGGVFALATVPAASGKREGIPNVLKEAMSCGLPVVASLISGIPELVEDGRSGLLVPPGDPRALASALERLEKDPRLRQRLGQAGREKVVRDFNLRVSTARRAELFLAHALRRPQSLRNRHAGLS